MSNEIIDGGSQAPAATFPTEDFIERCRAIVGAVDFFRRLKYDGHQGAEKAERYVERVYSGILSMLAAAPGKTTSAPAPVREENQSFLSWWESINPKPDAPIPLKLLPHWMRMAWDARGPSEAGTNYVANREVNPTQIKFASGRRVWINGEGGLDTDFMPLDLQAPAPDLEAAYRAGNSAGLDGVGADRGWAAYRDTLSTPPKGTAKAVDPAALRNILHAFAMDARNGAAPISVPEMVEKAAKEIEARIREVIQPQEQNGGAT